MYLPNNYRINKLKIQNKYGYSIMNIEANEVLESMNVTIEEFKELEEFGDFNDNPYNLYYENGSRMNFIDALRCFKELEKAHERIK